jgi:hypothetical protein
VSLRLLLLPLLLLLLLQWPDEVPEHSLFVLSDKVRTAAAAARHVTADLHTTEPSIWPSQR